MLQALRRAKRALIYSVRAQRSLGGSKPFECPACERTGYFAAVGATPRFDAMCRFCGALERHRHFAVAIRRLDPPLYGDGLHFAPERQVTAVLKPLLATYTGADLNPDRADLVVNLEAMALPNARYDVIVANHVLEHVNDRKALSEMFRVLRPKGRAILTFPIVEGWDTTYENPAVVTPEDRTIHFGQWDHVRYYGRDVRDRIASAGFHLTEDASTTEDLIRYGIPRGSRLFVATKP